MRVTHLDIYSCAARWCRAKLRNLRSGSQPRRRGWRIAAQAAVAIALASLPLLAADEAAPDPTDMPVGTVFRWLNFILVFGAIGYAAVKFGGPYFRATAQEISGSIREAADARAAAERELRQAEERLGAVNLEIQDMRRAAAVETTAEAERLRALARSEVEKVAKAAHAEIEASERAGRQELRALAARMAVDRAAKLIRAQMNPAMESALFESFIGELQRSAQ